jgi:hypothetical protein
MIVIGADGEPWTRSGSGPDIISRSIGTIMDGAATDAGEDVSTGAATPRE